MRVRGMVPESPIITCAGVGPSCLFLELSVKNGKSGGLAQELSRGMQRYAPAGHCACCRGIGAVAEGQQ